VENENTINQDFNISTNVSTTILELAELIWKKVNGDLPFHYVLDSPYQYDVQKRVPSVGKAERILGFKAQTTLSDALDEILPWIMRQVEIGGI
jgi:nucleoside-diphosphate-sugar epimerase